MNRFGWFGLFFLFLGQLAGWSLPVEEGGQRLAEFYDSLDVENLWLAGKKVHWKTGEPLPGDRPGKTHCSAFVAAACSRLGIYILRPPAHGQELLANAQAEWLKTKGAEHGWKPAESPVEAQRLANQGHPVAVVFQNPDPQKPGHIALVRPSDLDEQRLASDGTWVIQAGQHNHRCCTLKKGFKNHPGAWNNAGDYQVKFFFNQTSFRKKSGDKRIATKGTSIVNRTTLTMSQNVFYETSPSILKLNLVTAAIAIAAACAFCGHY
ncbi:MAG: hypothetical protein PHV34_24375 [Verrucomicrobiae bacterium]|nr:hypothetical protein [Verrucomicrobiae bacterium]